MPPTLALLHDLAAALEAGDPEAVFSRTLDLAELLDDRAAAVAVARALAADVDALRCPRWTPGMEPGLAVCA